MSAPLPPQDLLPMELPLTRSAEASHARTSAMQGQVRAWQASAAAFGINTPVLLASFDPASSSWRTSARCFLEGWMRFSEPLPPSGIMQSGKLYELPMSARHIKEPASGLWPTPTVNGNYNRKGCSATSGDGLATRVKMYPTPTATDFKGSVSLQSANARSAHPRGKRLPEALAVEMQTEVGGTLNPAWVEWLMGFPIGHTDLQPSGTPSSPKSPSLSDAP
jgi:hypothetical protein